MLDKIIDYYLTELSAKKLVFAKMKLVNIFFWIVIGISSLLVIILTFTKPLFVLFVMIGFFCFFYYFNAKTKKVIQREYGIEPSKGIWSGYEYQTYVQNQLRDYLESISINSIDTLDMLVTRLSKRVDETKVVIYFLPGLFFGFMIPSWAAYNATILFKDKNYESATILLVKILIGLVMLTFFLGMVKHQTNDLFSIRRQRLIQLLNLIQEIQLNYMLTQIDSEKTKVINPNEVIIKEKEESVDMELSLSQIKRKIGAIDSI